jgi:hypothetical protein
MEIHLQRDEREQQSIGYQEKAEATYYIWRLATKAILSVGSGKLLRTY